MGKDPCHLCSTPGVSYAEGDANCSGCGKTTIRAIIRYLAKRRKDIAFDLATFTYQRSPFASRISFGEWLVKFSLRLVARP